MNAASPAQVGSQTSRTPNFFNLGRWGLKVTKIDAAQRAASIPHGPNARGGIKSTGVADFFGRLLGRVGGLRPLAMYFPQPRTPDRGLWGCSWWFGAWLSHLVGRRPVESRLFAGCVGLEACQPPEATWRGALSVLDDLLSPPKARDFGHKRYSLSGKM